MVRCMGCTCEPHDPSLMCTHCQGKPSGFPSICMRVLQQVQVTLHEGRTSACPMHRLSPGKDALGANQSSSMHMGRRAPEPGQCLRFSDPVPLSCAHTHFSRSTSCYCRTHSFTAARHSTSERYISSEVAGRSEESIFVDLSCVQASAAKATARTSGRSTRFTSAQHSSSSDGERPL
jgi:hypothetical protein